MRTYLSALALVLSVVSYAQTYERVEVVTLDSTRSAQDIYRTAERWFVDQFKDAQEVIQLRDTVTNTLVGKGTHKALFILTKPAYASSTWWAKYSIEVQAKPGRYRIRVYDVVLENAPFQNTECCLQVCDTVYADKKVQKLMEQMMPSYVSTCSQVKEGLNGIFSSLHAAMVKATDDW